MLPSQVDTPACLTTLRTGVGILFVEEEDPSGFVRVTVKALIEGGSAEKTGMVKGGGHGCEGRQSGRDWQAAFYPSHHDPRYTTSLLSGTAVHRANL